MCNRIFPCRLDIRLDIPTTKNFRPNLIRFITVLTFVDIWLYPSRHDACLHLLVLVILYFFVDSQSEPHALVHLLPARGLEAARKIPTFRKHRAKVTLFGCWAMPETGPSAYKPQAAGTRRAGCFWRCMSHVVYLASRAHIPSSNSCQQFLINPAH